MSPELTPEDLKPGDIFRYKFIAADEYSTDQNGTYIGFAKRFDVENNKEYEGKAVLSCTDMYIYNDVYDINYSDFRLPIVKDHGFYKEFIIVEVLEHYPNWESINNVKKLFSERFPEYEI